MDRKELKKLLWEDRVRKTTEMENKRRLWKEFQKHEHEFKVWKEEKDKKEKLDKDKKKE
jgi:hypothetical protein